MYRSLSVLSWLVLLFCCAILQAQNLDPNEQSPKAVNKNVKEIWFESLKTHLDGDNWHIKDFNELLNRSKEADYTAPYFQKAHIDYFGTNNGGVSQQDVPIGEQRRPVTLMIIDLSNNNLSGVLADHSDDWLFTDSFDNGKVGRFYGQTRMRFSYNNLTEVTASLNRNSTTRKNVGSLIFDHNELTRFEPEAPDGSGAGGIYVTGAYEKVLLNNNRLASIPDSWNDRTEGIYFIYRTSDLFDISNNYLNFTELKKLEQYLEKTLTKGGNTNDDFIFEFFPQKPLGNDIAEKNLAGGTATNVSFNLPDAENSYYWELNGERVPLSETTDYQFTLNTATAGVYRCIVTNQAMPDLKIQSTDQAVFLQKAGNQNPTDFALSNTSMPENTFKFAIVGTFSGNDPDGDQLYYRLLDTEYKDNASFRIQNGNTLISSEVLFEHKFKTEYTIKVEAYDIYGGKFEQEIVITKGNPTVATPTDIRLTNNTIEENLIDEIGTIQLVGVDIANYNLSLPAVLDNAFFEIQGDKLFTRIPLNFEAKEEYPIRITATSTDGQISLSKDLVVRAINVNDPPNNLLLSTNTIVINNPPGTFIGVLVATDDDPADTNFTYELTSDDFTIENGNQLQSKRVFLTADIGDKPIVVTVTDPHGASREFNLTVVVEDEPLPAGAQIVLDNNTVLENYIGLVGKLSVDQNPTGAFTYTLVNGNGDTDNNIFEIVGNELRITSAVDYEAQQSLSVRIKNDATPPIEHPFTVIVENKNEAPTDIGLTSYQVTQNTPIGDQVATLLMLDVDGDQGIFSLKQELDAGYFTIRANQLEIAQNLDKNDFEIKVEATDGEFIIERVLKICLGGGTTTPVNVAPTDLGLSNYDLLTSIAVNTEIATIILEDENGDIGSFELSGIDAAYFTVNGNKLILAQSIDKASFEIVLKGDDGEFEVERTFILRSNYVDNGTVNIAPTDLGLSNYDLLTSTAVNTEVATIILEDENGDVGSFELSGIDVAYFTINGNKLILAQAIDKASFEIVLKGDDGEFEIERTFILRSNYVDNGTVNVAPTDLGLSNYDLLTSTAINTEVATIILRDENGDVGSFELSGADAAYFTVNGNKLILVQAIDKASFEIVLKGDDGEFEIERTFNLRSNYTDNTGGGPVSSTEPTGIGLSNLILVKEWDVGTTVSELFMKDEDKDAATFSLGGGGDNSFFEIDDQFLKLKRALTDNHSNRYVISITAKDESDNIYTQSVELYVYNEEFEPTDPTDFNTDIVYPNPVADDLNIRLDNNLLENFTITILDVRGQVMHTETFEKDRVRYEKSVPVSNYAQGVYFLQIEAESTFYYKGIKFLKK